MRSTWDSSVRFAALDLDLLFYEILAMMKSEKRELRRKIQEFCDQEEGSLKRIKDLKPLGQKHDNLVNISIGTDGKPKYVWQAQR